MNLHAIRTGQRNGTKKSRVSLFLDLISMYDGLVADDVDDVHRRLLLILALLILLLSPWGGIVPAAAGGGGVLGKK